MRKEAVDSRAMRGPQSRRVGLGVVAVMAVISVGFVIVSGMLGSESRLIDLGFGESQTLVAPPADCAATNPMVGIAGAGAFPFPPGPREQLARDLPASAVLCRYAGFNGPDADHLTGRGVLVGDDLAQLVNALNALPDASPLPPSGCPADTGTKALILMKYVAAKPITISVQFSGCAYITNGSNVVRLPDAGQRGQRVLDLITAAVGTG